MPAELNLVGQKYGRLLVMEKEKRRVGQRYVNFYKCKCDCGKEIEIPGKYLRCGDTKSCGCLATESKRKPKTHGATCASSDGVRRLSTTYNSWCGMKQRCSDPNHKDWDEYGGRGIKVCERWLGVDGYKHFLQDMGERPVGLTLDRINRDSNYTPFNCRWATDTEQVLNRRNTLQMVTYKGRIQPLSAWARELNFDYFAVYGRLKNKWDVERAFETPVRPQKPREKLEPWQLPEEPDASDTISDPG